MTCYCTLIIHSSDHASLPVGVFRGSAIKKFEFTDQESAERRASRQRMRAAGFREHPNLPRYWWNLDTKGRVAGDDVHIHLAWLLGQLAKGSLLSALTAQGYTYWFSMFWGGNGTGGGPLITHEAVALLSLHGAEMGVSFYHEQAPLDGSATGGS